MRCARGRQGGERPCRPRSGLLRQLVEAPHHALALVRGGWSNPNGAPRASAQRVEYRLAADRLERVAWPHVDGAQPFAPAVLLTGVRTFRLRYRARGEWRDAWDAENPSALPDAVEVVTDVDRVGTVRQLFLVGTGA